MHGLKATNISALMTAIILAQYDIPLYYFPLGDSQTNASIPTVQVPLGLVDAKLMRIIWPYHRWGALSSPTKGEDPPQNSPFDYATSSERKHWYNARVTSRHARS